jgi:hypothetical protein
VLPDETPDDLARNASAVVRGSIVEGRPGFYLGQPGTLYAVVVTESLKAARKYGDSEMRYIFAPSARIESAKGPFCAVSALQMPQVRDRILLFSLSRTSDATHMILGVDYARTVVIEHEGRVSAPAALATAGKSFDAIVEATRQNPHLREVAGRVR